MTKILSFYGELSKKGKYVREKRAYGIKVTEHQKTNCPGCGLRLNAAGAPLVPDASPNPGDLCVCLGCGQPLRYGPELELVALSTQDLARLERIEPETVRALRAMVKAAEGRTTSWVKTQCRPQPPGETL